MKKNAPPRFKLIANVSEFALLQPLARTRGRLIASALTAYALFFGGGLYVAHAINDTSTSVFLNLALITLVMLLMLIASYIGGMLFGDLFFPGRWRERVLLGQNLQIQADDPEAIDPTLHRDFNAHFLAAVAVITIASYFALNLASDNFLSEYNEMGFHLTRLRSDDEAEKQQALKELARSLYTDRWHEKKVSSAILKELDNPDEQTRRMAMFTVRRTCPRSDSHEPRRLVLEVERACLIQALPRLVELLDQGSPDSRADAALTLGALADRRATPHLARALKAASGNEILSLGAIRGAVLLNDPELAPAITPFMNADSPLVRAHAFWALGKLKHAEPYDEAMAIFEKAKGVDRCAPLVYLLYVAREADVQRFKDLFLVDREDTSECPHVIWEEVDGEKTYIIFKESQRGKYLKYVANAVGIKERDWFVYVASDQEMPYELRKLATDIVREIDRRP